MTGNTTVSQSDHKRQRIRLLAYADSNEGEILRSDIQSCSGAGEEHRFGGAAPQPHGGAIAAPTNYGLHGLSTMFLHGCLHMHKAGKSNHGHAPFCCLGFGIEELHYHAVNELLRMQKPTSLLLIIWLWAIKFPIHGLLHLMRLVILQHGCEKIQGTCGGHSMATGFVVIIIGRVCLC
jgi:hypothetical protein